MAKPSLKNGCLLNVLWLMVFTSCIAPKAQDPVFFTDSDPSSDCPGCAATELDSTAETSRGTDTDVYQIGEDGGDTEIDVNTDTNGDTGTDTVTNSDMEAGTDTDTADTDSDADKNTDSDTRAGSDTGTHDATDTDSGTDAYIGTDSLADTAEDGEQACFEPVYPWLRNVILFIGDGMGPSQVAAGGIYRNGRPGTLAFEFFPVQGVMTTHSANNPITDSAASSTAMATGEKVGNGVVSVQLPGDGKPLKTMLEKFSDVGMATGLVTNTTMTHATPAGFGAHAESRWDTTTIGLHYLNTSRPTVLLGGGGSGISADVSQESGYTVVTTADALEAVDPLNVERLFGQFGTSAIPFEVDGLGLYPHLSEMAVKAVDVLSVHPDGFFLMTESGRIDDAGHRNDLETLVFEVIEFEHTVVQALGQISLDNSLVIVTADHETGGLSIIENNGQMSLPTVQWSTSGHTAAHVPVYVTGVGAEVFQDAFDTRGIIDNTDIFHLVAGLFFKEACGVDGGEPVDTDSESVDTGRDAGDAENETPNTSDSFKDTDL